MTMCLCVANPCRCGADGGRPAFVDAQILAMAEIVTVVRDHVADAVCRCEPAFRDRSLHASDCRWVDVDDLREALAAYDAAARFTSPDPVKP